MSQTQKFEQSQLDLYEQYRAKWQPNKTFIEILYLQDSDQYGLDHWDGKFQGDQFVKAAGMHFLYEPLDGPTLQFQLQQRYPKGGWFLIKFLQSQGINSRQIGDALMFPSQPRMQQQSHGQAAQATGGLGMAGRGYQPAGATPGPAPHTMAPDAELYHLRNRVQELERAAHTAHANNQPRMAAEFSQQAQHTHKLIETLMTERQATQADERARQEFMQRQAWEQQKEVLQSAERQVKTVVDGQNQAVQGLNKTVTHLTEQLYSRPQGGSSGGNQQLDIITLLDLMDRRADRARKEMKEFYEAMRPQQPQAPMMPYQPYQQGHANPASPPEPQDPFKKVKESVSLVTELYESLGGLPFINADVPAKEEKGTLRELADLTKDWGIGDFVKDRLVGMVRPSGAQVRPPTLPPLTSISSAPKEEEKAAPKKEKKTPQVQPMAFAGYQPAGAPGLAGPPAPPPAPPPPLYQPMQTPGFPPQAYAQAATVGYPPQAGQMPQQPQQAPQYPPVGAAQQAQPQMQPQQPAQGPPSPGPQPPQYGHYPPQAPPSYSQTGAQPHRPPQPPAMPGQRPQLTVIEGQAQPGQPLAQPSPGPQPYRPAGMPPAPYGQVPPPGPSSVQPHHPGQGPGNPQQPLSPDGINVIQEPPQPPRDTREVIVEDDEIQPGFLGRDAIKITDPQLKPFEADIMPVLSGIYYACGKEDPSLFVKKLDKSKLGLLTSFSAEELAEACQEMITDELVNSEAGQAWVKKAAQDLIGDITAAA